LPKSFQIPLADAEKQRLIDRIENDMHLAKTSHMRYAEKCAGWLRKWESRVKKPAPGDEDKPNHNVPLVQWQVFNKLARDMQALLGENAQITAAGRGPSDADKVRKVGAYMTSRVFDQMKLVNPYCVFEFRRILNGWAAAYRPWWRKEFTTLDRGKEKRVCNYEGPGFFPLEPDHLVVPAERGVLSIQDFSYTIRRVRVTIDDLQRGDGTLFQGTSDIDFVREAINWAQTAPSNDYLMTGQDPVTQEQEKTAAVDYDSFMLGRRSLWMWEWFGYWRPLRKQNRDAEIDALERRLKFEADWVIRFIPGMKKIVGCQSLLELYPKMDRRRPFVESTLTKDGTYRPKGFGALLEDLEDEATANSQLFTAAGELSVWPIIFYKPGAGLDPKAFKLEPGMAIPSEDPAGVNVVAIRPNLEYSMEKQQDVLSTAERVTGITDQSLGRAIDRPNAPRTATGQLALIEEGNVRAWLDATILREDMEQILEDFWDLDCDLAPKTEPGIFFRVTEEQANGLFDVKQGGAYMTAKEFGGKYDFKLKFATSVYARQAKKAEFAAFYQAAMMSPLVMQNPKAMWVLLNRLAREFDIDDFENIIPKPPDLDQPLTPEDEWTKMLEGEAVSVNPQDDDAHHLQVHIQQLEDERKDPDRDEQAIGLLVKHIIDTEQQQRIKMLMQAMTQQLMQQIQSAQPGAAQQTLQQLQQLYGAGGQPGMPGMGQPPGQQPPGMPPGMPPGLPGQPQGGPGEIGPPPAAVGSQAAPVATEGML